MADITSVTLGELLKRLYASWEIAQLVNLTHPAIDSCAQKGSAALPRNLTVGIGPIDRSDQTLQKPFVIAHQYRPRAFTRPADA